MTIAGRYDALIDDPRMRELYGDSGYFNVGFWATDVTTLPDACDRLVDELARSVPVGARTILDVGCGLGAGTRRLADRFPDALVVGVNISAWQLGHARKRGVQAVAVMDAARLAVADGSVDAVFAMESAQHFDTRAAFLAEAHRVLRPGGTLAVADMLFHTREPVGTWMLPAANAGVRTPEEYAGALSEQGFGEVDVRDVTQESWLPYCRVLRTVFPGHEEVADTIERSLSHYVLATATRP